MFDISLLPNWVWLVYFALIGLCFGSFANVVIYRLPQGKSVVRPRSRCTSCQAAISWFDNLPVLSWVLLKGRCRRCQKSISWRYPLVEILMSLTFVGVFWFHGWQWTTLEYLILSFGLIVVTFIDFDHMILPDVFTLSGVVIGLVGSLLNPERSFFPAFWGFLMGGGFFYAVAYLYLLIRKEEGMGGGDIKMMAWIGAVLSWTAVPFVILAASLIGSLVGVIVAVTNKDGLRSSIPFGPYLALGALLYIMGGEQIGRWYIGLFLPASVTPN